jgi:hypothetical protein
MKRLMIAAAVIGLLSATPASAETYRTYRCSNSTALRVIFDDERGTATVVPFGRPSIRLQRTETSSGGFRFARRDTHELRGTAEQVQWRAGAAQWTCRRAGS